VTSLEFKHFKDNQGLILTWIFAIKGLLFGLGMEEVLFIGVCFAMILSRKIVDFYCPKPPDVQREIAALSGLIEQMQVKIDSHEHDLTSLKFVAVRK
jgi:hypothetical protein